MGGKGTGGAEHAGGHGGNGAGRVDQGRGFAYNAARCQNHAGQDARHGAGQHNGEYGAQLAGPQAKAALAVRIRHCKQRFLGGAHDDRQHHDGQREGTGDQAVAPFELHDKEQHTEQTVHDGGDALQRFGGDAHHLDQLAAAFGVFHQPDRSKNAQRCGNGQ